MPKIAANGIEIGYEIHGQGMPLVLIAGISYDRWMWHRMIPGLAQDFQVIAFDNRGVGESSKPPGIYSAQMLADDTAGLLDGLGIEKAFIAGHSMGGFVAQALALSHPQRVERLILSATNFGGPRHVPIPAEALAVLMDASGNPLERLHRGLAVSCAPGFVEGHPELVQELIDYRIRTPIDPAAYQSQLGVGLGLMAEEACFEHRLKEIQVPTLILSGEHDRVVPPANAWLLAQQIPNSTVQILPNAGHLFPIEAPDEAVEAIRSFGLDQAPI